MIKSALLWSRTGKSRGGGLISVAALLGAIPLSLLIGVWGGVAGWLGLIVLLALVIPVAALLVDYRLGLILCILILPYTNAPLLKGMGLFTVTNLLLLGTFLVILAHWVLSRLTRRDYRIVMPRFLFLLYLLPIFVGMLIGTRYIDQIPAHYIAQTGYDDWNARSYWVSYWLKGMLLVLFAVALASAVVEHKRGEIFIRTAIASSVLFAVLVFVIVISSGQSLGSLQSDRTFLFMTGRHNTEAGFILACSVTILLFVREYILSPMAKLVILAVIAFLLAAMLLTFTRGAVLAMIAVMLYYVWHFKRPMVIVSAVVIVVLAALAMPDAVRDRMLLGLSAEATSRVDGAGGTSDPLTMGRTWVWLQLAEEIPKAPILGKGVLSTQWSDLVKRGEFLAAHTHNMYLAVIMDLGFVGLLAMTLFFYKIWRIFDHLTVSKTLTPLEKGFFAGAKGLLIAVLAWGVGNGQYFPLPEQILVWIAIGLGIGYHELTTQGASDSSGDNDMAALKHPQS